MINMHTTNYMNAFIAVAEDCPVTTAEIPPLKRGTKTSARFQYDFISENPYSYTSDDVIFGLHAAKHEIPDDKLKQEREKFFSKGQPCLRASALGKRYGWGIHCNEEGRIAIYAVESPEYQKLAGNNRLKQLKAMRSQRG